MQGVEKRRGKKGLGGEQNRAQSEGRSGSRVQVNVG